MNFKEKVEKTKLIGKLGGAHLRSKLQIEISKMLNWHPQPNKVKK